jgi:hypothetical protein
LLLPLDGVGSTRLQNNSVELGVNGQRRKSLLDSLLYNGQLGAGILFSVSSAFEPHRYLTAGGPSWHLFLVLVQFFLGAYCFHVILVRGILSHRESDEHEARAKA